MSKRKIDRRGLPLARKVHQAMTDRDVRAAMARKSVSVLPTFLTLGNAICGFGAITFAGRWTGFDQTTSLFAAACLIYLAMVFDALDGSTARRLKQTSEFGAQLDSLCDAISFGAAPALLMLQLAAGFHHRLLWLIAALYVSCTVLRLARYNVESDDTVKDRSFCGLPSPAAAGTVASFPLMVFGLKSLEITADDFMWKGFADWTDWAMARILPPVTLLVACLMVSRVRYPDTFHYMVRGRQNVSYMIKLVFAVAVIFVMPQIAVPLLFGWYAFSTPMRALWRRRTQPPTLPIEETPPEQVHVEGQ
ncbi:CDP-diacylglycerol--serine O-phosphatidyltransferase [Zavarzinella formosa]|uniref:CDP-diacylglycerol--serine O-phosphatidyltransferase n=1 Tax=Zavarzinella formosa TaxID=360055 RepID=UPI0003806E4F|nr:CDP-diacylglycerol--serine O-phosphatidyltransferase [Zavarzinella formosa]